VAKKMKVVCKKCKSDNISLNVSVDAYWNVETQQWELDTWYASDQSAFCCECEVSTEIEDIPA
jgi:hypothetical protein